MRPNDTTVHRRLAFSTDEALRRRFSIDNDGQPANVRWGLLLEVLDKLAEDVALDHARRARPDARVVTAAIDEVVLRTPADINRDLHLHARINYVGTSSMEVGMRVDQDGHGSRSLASCYFTMVARSGVDETAVSLPIPPLTYVDQLEKFRYTAALASRQAYRAQASQSRQAPDEAEYQMLAALHAAQESPGFTGHLARDLVLGSWEHMYSEHENVPSKIFGGFLMRRALEFAVIHARQFAPHRPVVVAINRINFLQPVRIGDRLNLQSRIVYAGHASFCVETDIRRVSRDNVASSLSNTCTFTFVNVDRSLRPQPVPKVFPSTYAEDARYLAAFRRHGRHRSQERSGVPHKLPWRDAPCYVAVE